MFRKKLTQLGSMAFTTDGKIASWIEGTKSFTVYRNATTGLPSSLQARDSVTGKIQTQHFVLSPTGGPIGVVGDEIESKLYKTLIGELEPRLENVTRSYTATTLPDPATLAPGAVVVVTESGLPTISDGGEFGSPVWRRSLSVGIVGDSLTGRCFNACDIVPASCSQTGGVGTLKLSYAPDAPIGCKFTMHGWDSDLWNGEFTVTGHTSATTVLFSIDPSAPSAPTSSGFNPIAQFYNKHSDRSWFHWAQATSGLDLNLQAFAGRGSRTSTQILTDFGTLIVNKKPNICIIETPANDAKNGLSSDKTINNMTAMVGMCKRAGILPIICTTSPYGSSFYTAGRLATQLDVNMRLRKLCKVWGIPLWDWHKLLVDPKSATGYPKTGYLDTDNIHLTPTSAIALGTALAAILKGFGFCSPIRGLDSIAEPTNKCTATSLSGTTGNLAGGATGQVATNCIVTAATSTVVASKGTKGILGSSQIVALSGSAGAASVEFGVPSVSALVEGKTIYGCVKVDITSAAPFRLKSLFEFNNDNGGIQHVSGMFGFSNSALIPAGTYSLTLPTPELTLPAAGTFTSIKMQTVLYMDTAGSTASFEVYEPVLFID